MNLRSLALLVFIFGASAALAGYIGMKYEQPAPPQRAQAVPAAPAQPAPPVRPLRQPQAFTVPPAPAAPERKSVQDVPPPARAAVETAAPRPAEAPKTTGAKEAEAAKCNKQACESAYRSFDAGDCTYQPANGPRRLCRK